MKINRQSLIPWITLALLLLATPAGAVTLTDVPTGHWAYEAVSTLVEKGYMHVGEDQLFRGDEPADRYTLATVVAKIITEIESGRVSTTPEDVRILRELIEEFRTELVFYYAEVQRVEGEAEGLYQEMTALDELLAKTIVELSDIDRRTLQLEQAIAAHAALSEELDGRLTATNQQLVTEVTALRSSIDGLAASLGVDLQALRVAVEGLGEDLDRRTFDLTAADQQLRQDIAALLAETQALRGTDAALEEQIAALAAELKAEANALIAQERSEREMALDGIRGDIDHLMLLLSQQGTELSGQLAGQAGETTTRISELRAALTDLESEFAERLAATETDLAKLEELIALTRDGVYDNAEGLIFLSHALEQAEQKHAELAQRLAETAEGSAAQFRAVDQALAEIREQLQFQGSGLASSELNLAELQRTLEQVRNELTQIASEHQTANEALARVDGQLLAALEDLNRQLMANQEASAATEEKVAALEAAIANVQVSLLSRLDALETENAALQSEMSGLRKDLLVLQSQVGLSEEQVLELTQRVKEEMANQLTLSLVREGELERRLTDLRNEFDSYRETTDQQLKTAGTAQALGIGALILGLIALVM